MRKTWIVPALSAALVFGRDTDFPFENGDSNVLLIKRKGPDNDVAAFHKTHGGKITRFHHIPWEAVEVKPEELRHYTTCPLFERVYPERIYATDVAPNDLLFLQQWALAKIEAPTAWDKATSNNVIAAVIDTGIDFSHPDLQANLWTGPQGEHGYTAIGGVITNGGRDDHYHGTHVAGTIGGVGNNGIGIAGVNWRTKLLSLKFIRSSGFGSTRDAILCIEKMIDLKQAGHNVRVSNNSWGGGGEDPALYDAFQAAGNAGILNVCAAGNNNVDIDETQFLPAGFDLESIISVLASDQNDNRAFFSNYGAISTDLFAPGVAVLSCRTNNNYWNLSGTSMASPHVAGAMAMMFAFNPSLTMSQARTILLAPPSYDRIGFALNSTGGGRLNLRKLWNNSAISNPPPANLPPVLARFPNTNILWILPGQTLATGVMATDPEGETNIIYSLNWDTYRLPWFYRYIMGGTVLGGLTNFSGSSSANILFHSGKYLALDQITRIRFGASDRHGGGANARTTAITPRDETKVRDIEQAIRGFQFYDDISGHPYFRLDMDANYPDIETVRYEVRISGDNNGLVGGGIAVPCCWQPNVTHRAAGDGFITNATYSVRALVSDGFGNVGMSQAVEYHVSNSTLHPPFIRMTVNTNRGLAPLSITADLSATLKGSATQLSYTAVLLDEGGVTFDASNPVRQFTLTDPGVYAMEFGAYNPGATLVDKVIKTFTVLPAWPAKLTIMRNGYDVQLSWTIGVLQESSDTLGPWTDGVNQANPQTRSATGSRQFFKLR